MFFSWAGAHIEKKCTLFRNLEAWPQLNVLGGPQRLPLYPYCGVEEIELIVPIQNPVRIGSGCLPENKTGKKQDKNQQVSFFHGAN